MGNSDDDDDTHFCIKCHATIGGLQNYVDHRNAKCQTSIHAPSTASKSVLTEDDYFFSSLCLKSTSNVGVVSSVGKPPVGILTRSKIGGGTKNKGTNKDQPEDKREEENEFEGETFVEVLQETSAVQSYLSDPLAIGIDENEITEDESDEEQRNRWMNSLWPPPSHTGGKWKPPGTPTEELERNESVPPPPDHTQGKWGPSDRSIIPSRKTHFWCSPCNRRLSSKLAYSKHVKSEFHYKRANALQPTSRSSEKRKRRPSQKMLEASAKIVSNKLKVNRPRHTRGPVICPVCRYKVWPHLMGKHLVSHYHCRRPGDKTTSDALVLKEMGSIVRQAPFQCGMCKFYCNSNETFMRHWHSKTHLQKDHEVCGTYLCSFCPFKTVSTGEMGKHLIGESHTGVVAVINNSMPIVIHKRTPLKCFVCQKTFRYNIQIRNHAKAANHIQLGGTASDSYQEIMKCEYCQTVSHSRGGHQTHLRVKHNAFEYFCRPCDLKFATAQAARKHRKSASHLDVTSRKPKKCMHCDLTCANMGELKRHIEEVHALQKSRCLKCGASFPLKQMLSRHVKGDKCPGLPQSFPLTSDGKLSCPTCLFTCDHQSDVIVHTILHGEPSTDGTYECPKCLRRVKKDFLRKHVKKHKLEMNYSCKFCFETFGDSSTLSEHLKKNHDDYTPLNQQDRSQQVYQWKNERERRYKCSDCGASFYERAVLSRHFQIHRGKKLQCDHPDCIFSARSNWELANHVRTHSVDRTFHCQCCSYSAKTKAQLAKHIKGMHVVGDMKKCPHCNFSTQHSTHMKRHLRIHSGAKPYKCPYCNYTCNLLENLRKHVVNSKKHPNKSVYECKKDGCSFHCNRAQDYKIHLVQEHGEDKSKAASFVAGLYRPEQDVTVPSSQIIERKKRKKPTEHTSVELVVAGEDVSPILATTATTSASSSTATAAGKTSESSSVFIDVEDEPDEDYATQVNVYGEEFIINDSFDVDSDEIEIVISSGSPA